MVLHGREMELETVANLVQKARGGGSGALVLRGEPGAGKTALLDHIAATVTDIRVLRCTGIESEAELPFAALHLMLRSYTDRIDELPAPQAVALRGAFGLAEPVTPDPFLAGLGILTLLSAIAEDGPVLCLVDDAQWLDQASRDALAFAGRRLHAEGVAFVLAAEEDGEAGPAWSMPELPLAPLDRQAAADLLAEYASDLAPAMRDRIVAEGRGNPLALIELPASLSAAQRAGELPPALPNFGARSATSQVEQGFRTRIAGLPRSARTAVLVAAADDSGDLSVVLRAAESMGARLGALEVAERARLIEMDHDSVAFRHPLIRTAAYQHAPVSLRFAAHRAIADVLGGQGDDDRRAWHLAAAATAPQDEVAERLAGVAKRAEERGGHAAAAAAYERSAELASDGAVRARRLMAAAGAARQVGHLKWAGLLADRAAPLAEAPMILARLDQVRAAIELGQGAPGSSGRLLVRGAVHVASEAPDTAAEMLAEAAGRAYFDADWETAELAARHLADLAMPAPFATLATAAYGISRVLGGDLAGGLPELRRAVRTARGDQLPIALRRGAARWAFLAGDDEATHDLSVLLVTECRTQGLIGLLPHVAHMLIKARLFLGLHADAHAAGAEALQLAHDTGQGVLARRLRLVLARLAATEGDAHTCRELASADVASGSVAAAAWSASALALLDLGELRPEAAHTRLADVMTGPARHSTIATFSIPDFVESAAGTGQAGLARAAFTRFEEFARYAEQPWARAVASRCRALLDGGETAERHFALAIEEHGLGGRPFERARTELLYGEWLRRELHRTRARVHLRRALDIFEGLGAPPWAERTRTELRAAGELLPVTHEAGDLLARLTPQELQVVRLAATGLSNRDIAGQMSLSPRTVGYHLYKAYPKLGVSSRTDLVRLDLGGR
ncbi:DNA-binding CsgD family transcriptional regulator [Lipingzhangella halophila]|uniref:DNA-binding CsgD family transcriptional regulator n=1 Tax=Lipingzhangella halophila TaxID=1783352 RepID=A0A7W7RCS1_9ACTN|nr:LuxR family transcriptional regulator [Lipingzhangella halophila]MBB4929620.1 DNA-binding CsgD family transcriptional regulator [Lipingzhangella halophila]